MPGVRQTDSGVVIASGGVAQTVVQATGDPPDSGDLQAHYDATEISASDGDPITSLSDQTGNGHDLSGGSPTYRASGINGNPILEFDGSDDELSTAWQNLTQPNTIFAVMRFRATGTDNQYAIGSEGSSPRNAIRDSGSAFELYAGIQQAEYATYDEQPHIFTALFDGGTSIARLDGTTEDTDDAGTHAMGGPQLGATDGVAYASVDIGEVLIYPSDKSGIFGDVETYLSDKWGITV